MECLEWDAILSDLYDKSKSTSGVVKTFVLDGQQRLQTLYTLFSGSIKASEGKQPLEAYIDVTGGHILSDDGLLYQLTFEKDAKNLPLYRLRDLLGRHDQRNAEEIADELNEQLDANSQESQEDMNARQKRVRRNIGQLVSLLRE